MVHPLLSSISAEHCGYCVDENPSSLFSSDHILQCQKVSDFLIALAYFSIPLELFYFVTCAAILPFRWVFIQFGAFIVLCGLTHLANSFTYAPHTFILMLALTVLKFLTAVVSLATAVSFVPIIPQMLRLFVRDGILRQRARDLDIDISRVRRRTAAAWRVRMLTAEIRRSIDRNTILTSTLHHLADALYLQDCAVWMPNSATSIAITHQLHPEQLLPTTSLSTAQPDVAQIISNQKVVILDPMSDLVRATSGAVALGPAASIRLPLLKVRDFNVDNPSQLVEASYAVLVVVLMGGEGRERDWTSHELEILEVVADQVAIALSHASILEESILMKEKLMEQNVVLNRAHHEALVASQTKDLFQRIMTHEIVVPIRSVAAVLSALRFEGLNPQQLALVKVELVLASLMEEAARATRIQTGSLELKLQEFYVHALLDEVIGMSRLLCASREVPLKFHVSGQHPGIVIGDKRRILQAVLCIVGNLLGSGNCGVIVLKVFIGGDGVLGESAMSKHSDNTVDIKFEVTASGFSGSKIDHGGVSFQEQGTNAGNSVLIAAICERLAKLMYGSFSCPRSSSLEKSLTLNIKLHRRLSSGGNVQPRDLSIDTMKSAFKGMRVLLVDNDLSNIALTRRLFEKLGCSITLASSRYSMLETLYLEGNQMHLFLVDLEIIDEDRVELPARIKELRAGAWPLVIALTPKADRSTRERCAQDGMNGVICKPVIFEQMIDEFQRISQQIQIKGPFP